MKKGTTGSNGGFMRNRRPKNIPKNGVIGYLEDGPKTAAQIARISGWAYTTTVRKFQAVFVEGLVDRERREGSSEIWYGILGSLQNPEERPPEGSVGNMLRKKAVIRQTFKEGGLEGHTIREVVKATGLRGRYVRKYALMLKEAGDLVLVEGTRDVWRWAGAPTIGDRIVDFLAREGGRALKKLVVQHAATFGFQKNSVEWQCHKMRKAGLIKTLRTGSPKATFWVLTPSDEALKTGAHRSKESMGESLKIFMASAKRVAEDIYDGHLDVPTQIKILQAMENIIRAYHQYLGRDVE